MRYVLLFAFLIIGCGEGGDRDARRERRRNRRDEPAPIVEPVKVSGMTAAQKLQAKGRADGMRELAAAFKRREIKTLWDAAKQYREADKQTRIVFDQALQERLEKEFGSEPNDDLPSTAGDVFVTIANELDEAAK